MYSIICHQDSTRCHKQRGTDKIMTSPKSLHDTQLPLENNKKQPTHHNPNKLYIQK